jgi:signal transduction histidine kinase
MVSLSPNNSKQLLKTFQFSFRIKDLWLGFALFLLQTAIAITQIQSSPALKEQNNSWGFFILTHSIILLLIILLQYCFYKLHKTEAALEQAAKVKSEFLANVTHELRTPMNSIIGFSEILMSTSNPELTIEQKELVQIITDSSHHLLDLINNIIQVSKTNLMEMKLDKNECNIVDLVEKCISFFRYKLNVHSFNLQNELTKEEMVIKVDQRLLLQVLINLIGNAIKFTPERKPIGVKIQKSTSYMIITIWDEGIGIDPQDIKKLFRPFSQIEPSISKNFQGSGLGLYICKKIIELHGGKINCESQKGVGSKFIIFLPFTDKQMQIEHNAESLLDTLWNP